MPIRAYLVLLRTRLLWSAAIALLVPIAVVLVSASDGRPDFGVFWNHFCGCAPGNDDAFALLYASTFTAFAIGLLLSVETGSVTPSGSVIPYTLTRPMRRSSMLFAPVVIAVLAVVVLPALGFALVFGWMRLVHAPALAFFPRALRLIPAAAALPPNASLSSLLVAAHLPPSYLASVSIGLFAYVLLYSRRWLMLSRHVGVRTFAAFQSVLLYVVFPASRHISPRVASWLYLVPQGHGLAWHPSALLLLIHCALPAALMFLAWRTLQTADL